MGGGGDGLGLGPVDGQQYRSGGEEQWGQTRWSEQRVKKTRKRGGHWSSSTRLLSVRNGQMFGRRKRDE